jgi:hypothetical protein
MAIAQPSLADRGKLMKSPDYTDVTKALDELLKPSDSAEQSETSAADRQQKLSDLQFQKYILETASNRAQCTNETGKTIGVYLKSKKAPASEPSTLYYLADGQMTDDDLDCDGVFLPTGAKVSLSPFDTQGAELTEPLAIKVVDGTQLTIKSNPETGAVGFNVPFSQVFKAGEGNWSIPTIAQADVEAQTPNAPVED